MDYFKILPPDITLEILTRLLDCKIVCTNWRNIISHHPSFSKMQLHHVNHTAAESGKLGFHALTYRRKLHYFEYDEGHDQSTKPIQRITRISFTPPFEHFRVRIVGSYNGLICLSDYSHQSVCICNPITREYLMLPEIKRDCDTDGYSYEENSFGYVSSTNEYKVVGFYKFKTYLEVRIYTLGSGNGWRNLGKFNFGYRVCLKYQVLFANGAFYWLDEKFEVIGVFDLAEEKFCEHLSPPPLPPYCDWYCRRIGVLDGFLYFALEDEVDGFQHIWLLKKKNHNHHKEEGEKHQSLGWSEELRIDGRRESLAATNSDGVLTYDIYYLSIYDTKTSTFQRLVKFKNLVLQVFPHGNTLVSLKELGEEDTKVTESAKIEETKSREQLQEDADPEYIYL